MVPRDSGGGSGGVVIIVGAGVAAGQVVASAVLASAVLAFAVVSSKTFTPLLLPVNGIRHTQNVVSSQ